MDSDSILNPALLRKSATPPSLSERSRRWVSLIETQGARFPIDLAERFPHIADRLAASWGQPSSMDATMQDLLFDRRAGRAGFPEAMLSTLFALHAAHAKIFPLPASRMDIWTAIHAENPSPLS